MSSVFNAGSVFFFSHCTRPRISLCTARNGKTRLNNLPMPIMDEGMIMTKQAASAIVTERRNDAFWGCWSEIRVLGLGITAHNYEFTAMRQCCTVSTDSCKFARLFCSHHLRTVIPSHGGHMQPLHVARAPVPDIDEAVCCFTYWLCTCVLPGCRTGRDCGDGCTASCCWTTDHTVGSRHPACPYWTPDPALRSRLNLLQRY